MDFKFNFSIGDEKPVKDNPSTILTKPETNQVTRCDSYLLQDLAVVWKQKNIDDIYSIESVEVANGDSIHFVQPCVSGNQACLSMQDETRCIKTSDIPAELLETSDLIPKVYEGGLKIWECSIDMVNFMLGSNIEFNGKIVLELGCGIGLPGITAGNLGAKRVIFQDYNDYVITKATGPSVRLNEWLRMKNLAEPVPKRSKNDFYEDLEDILTNEDGRLTEDKFSFISGDWGNVCEHINDKVDVIITAETIYDLSCYEKLHNVIETTLAYDGVAYLAAKSFYFGVGGGIHNWTQFVASKAMFKVESVRVIDAPLKREILKMSFITNKVD